MSAIEFTEKTWPESAEEFRRALQDASLNRVPMDDFVQLVRDLTLLEQEHGLSSAEFYQRYEQGEMGDEMTFIRWATKYEIYEEMRAEFDNTFALLEKYALPLSV